MEFIMAGIKLVLLLVVGGIALEVLMFLVAGVCAVVASLFGGGRND